MKMMNLSRLMSHKHKCCGPLVAYPGWCNNILIVDMNSQRRITLKLLEMFDVKCTVHFLLLIDVKFTQQFWLEKNEKHYSGHGLADAKLECRIAGVHGPLQPKGREVPLEQSTVSVEDQLIQDLLEAMDQHSRRVMDPKFFLWDKVPRQRKISWLKLWWMKLGMKTPRWCVRSWTHSEMTPTTHTNNVNFENILDWWIVEFYENVPKKMITNCSLLNHLFFFFHNPPHPERVGEY